VQYLQQQQQQQQQHQQQHLLEFWDACAHGEAVRQQYNPSKDHTKQTFSSSNGPSTAQLLQQGYQPPGEWGAIPVSSNEELAAAEGAWEQQQLQRLLQQHAGMAQQQASSYVQVCVQLQELLLQLEQASAAAAGRVLQLPPLTVLRKISDDPATVGGQHMDQQLAGNKDSCSEGGATSSSTSTLSAGSSSSSNERQTSTNTDCRCSWSGGSSSSQLLPGFSIDYAPTAALALDVSETVLSSLTVRHYGPLAVHGLATLLVRLSLSQLPGQQQQQQVETDATAAAAPAAAATAASVSAPADNGQSSSTASSSSSSTAAEVLQGRLTARLAVLKHLQYALKQTVKLSEQHLQHASSSQLDTDQPAQLLQQHAAVDQLGQHGSTPALQALLQQLLQQHGTQAAADAQDTHRQQQTVLLHLLLQAGFSLRASYPAARALQEAYKRQQQLLKPLQEALLGPAVAADVGMDSSSWQRCCRRAYATACSALEDVFATDVLDHVAAHMGLDQQQQQQQKQQLLEEHSELWAAGASVSSGRSRSSEGIICSSSAEQSPPDPSIAAAAAATGHCGLDLASVALLLDQQKSGLATAVLRCSCRGSSWSAALS
jgi:hypothetical protein